MLYKLTTILLVILLFGFLQAQSRYSLETSPKVVFTGAEISEPDNSDVSQSTYTLNIGPVNSGSLTWEVHNIANIQSGYDLQSNSSTEQIWCDLANPGNLHAVFTFSALATGWTDRTSLYLGSIDGGETWIEFGGVPVNTGGTGHSGYCRIGGLADGSAVIMNHVLDAQSRPYTQLWIDGSPYEYNFTNFNPGYVTHTNQWALWPRFIIDSDDNIIFGSSQSANYGTVQGMYTNRFDFATSLFDGWVNWEGDQAETYPFSISDGGIVGQAYHGETDTPNEGNVFYRYSTDGGVTWSDRDTIYTKTVVNDTGYGAIRGIGVNFYGEEPCMVFETAWQNFATNEYRQGWPQELLFWSPNINGGVPKVLVDSSWVNYNVGGGPNDVYLGVSRPVLARSQSGDVLLLAFSGASEFTDPNNANAPYFHGYFMYSTDGGDTWTDPERFTPDLTPRLDWRYISIPHILPVSQADDFTITVHLTAQGDTIAGSQVQGTPKSRSAKYYHFSTEIPIVGVGDDINTVNAFNLEQNYPNPFNPSTKIDYTLAERSAVTLKVYDILGKEVATLVNSEQAAGKHSITFDAGKFASGLYIYTLSTGKYTSSKKMMLLK